MPDNEKGFVLITVLLVIAFLFPLVLAFNSKVQLNLIQAENFNNSVQALRLASSGIRGAMGMLKMDDASYDSPKDTWATTFPSLAFGEGAAQGTLSVKIVDEDGKIPINALVKQPSGTNEQGGQAAGEKTAQDGKKGQQTDDPVDKELDARLRLLVTELGGNPGTIDALIDWLDSDDVVRGSEGAEGAYYKERGIECKNGPIDSLDELLAIKGFDKELVVKLKDYLTVAPRTDTKINLNTASLEVLKAILGTDAPGSPKALETGDIEDLCRYREEHEFRKTTDIQNAIKPSQSQQGRVDKLAKVNSSYFTATSKYTIGRVTKTVEAMLKRDGSNVTIVSWREF